MTSHTLHPTHNAVYILQSSSRWRPDHNSLLSFTTIAQPYIPIYTAHHGRFATHTLSYTLSKIKISKMFWALFRGRSGFPPHFRIPLLPLHILKFFRRFDLPFRFLLHSTAKGLNCTVLRPCCATPRGANLWAVAHTWSVFFPPHPWNWWSLNSTVTPTPLLYSFFSFSPKSIMTYSEGHTT